MASRYVFTGEQIQELTNAAKANKRKDADRRLRALLMRSEGKKLTKAAQTTGYSFSNITKLVRRYRGGGLSAIVENHYGGNHRNMSCEEEKALLEPFRKEAEAGQIVEASEMEAAYQEAAGHSIGTGNLACSTPTWVEKSHAAKQTSPKGHRRGYKKLTPKWQNFHILRMNGMK